MSLIVSAVRQGQYQFTVHGAGKQIDRLITDQEIEEVMVNGEIIEDYQEHYLGPACLILGWTSHGRPLHIVCSAKPVVDIITVYEPEPEEWEPDLRTRKATR